MAPFDEIRESLKEALGVSRLRSGLWKDLVHSRYVDLAVQGRWSMEMLAQQYRRKEEDLYPPKRSRQEPLREIDPDAREVALAEIIALRAARSWPVLAFRQTHLKDVLVPEAEIADWVEARAEEEGPPAQSYFSMPVDARYEPLWLIDEDPLAGYARWLAAEAARVAADPRAEVPSGLESGPRWLEYGVPGQLPRSLVIRGDGVLAQLHAAAAGLFGIAGRAGWSPFQAVAFLLSGWVPPMPKASATAGGGLCRAGARLNLRLNPRLAPRDVAAFYSAVRAHRAGGTDRPMNAKHLALAVFTEESRNSGASWLELREHWNGAHPQWAYAGGLDPHARRFSLDARTAWGRVTGDAWPKRSRNKGAARRPPAPT